MYVPRARGFCLCKRATRPSAWVGVGERGERERVGECVRARACASAYKGKRARAWRIKSQAQEERRAKRREPKHPQHKLKRQALPLPCHPLPVESKLGVRMDREESCRGTSPKDPKRKAPEMVENLKASWCN